MKTKSPALAEQREQHVMKWKREKTQTLNFLSLLSCCSNVLSHCFGLHTFVSGVRTLYGAHSNMGAANLVYLHIVLASFHSCLYLFVSASWETFKTESSLTSTLVVEGGTYSLPLVLYCVQDLGSLFFFLVIFNFRWDTPVISWRTTCALA